MNRRLALGFSALLLATPVTAATWTVDYSKSRLGFVVSWSGEAFAASFKTWKADIVFDPANLGDSKANVTVDLSSESSDSNDNDEGLRGPQGFSVSQFPTAKFQTSGFVETGNGKYVATGRLSLHGITKAIALPFTLSLKANQAHMSARAVVLRSDFGLGTGEWAADQPIGHAVTITVELTATKSN